MKRASNPMLSAAALVLALGLAGPATAQQSRDFGDYTVHYNTLNTNLLPADTARAYGIQRAGTRALVNIAVQQRADREPVAARVEASAINLNGQRRELNMREIREEEAIYYIGHFRVHDEEILDFHIVIRPLEAPDQVMELDFRQQFFTD